MSSPAPFSLSAEAALAVTLLANNDPVLNPMSIDEMMALMEIITNGTTAPPAA